MSPSAGVRGASAPIGSPSRTTSRGRGIPVGGAAGFAFATVGFGFGFSLGFGFAVRAGVVGRTARVAPLPTGAEACDVGALRVDDADEVPGAASGAGIAAGFVTVDPDAVVADDVTGASGVGTGCADSAARFVLGAERVVVALDVSTVETLAGSGGSSGVGIGVPPAAHPLSGHASATRKAPVPSAPPFSRRDDVHPDITSLPVRAHRTSEDVPLSTGVRGAGRRSRRPAPYVLTQRFFLCFIPPWIAWTHAPPRWSSHEPWPATCRESEP